MKKRLVQLLLICCLAAGVLMLWPLTASAAQSGVCGANLRWTLDDAGILTVSGSGEMQDYPANAPWFAYKEDIKSVVIEEGVTGIGFRAFIVCSNITDVSLPESLTRIGDYAFSACSKLTSITIPNGITKINSEVFSGCTALTDVTLPSGLITIGRYAFSNCSSLTGITIPNTVTTIEDSAFSGCSGLTDITLPDSLTAIGTYAFSGCSALTELVIPQGVTKISDYAFQNCRRLYTVSLPDSVTSIGNDAFVGCDNLSAIDLGSGITTIGNSAFLGCLSLYRVVLPDGVTSIGSNAFAFCSTLKSITFPGSLTTIGEGAFTDCYALQTVLYTGMPGWWEAISIGDKNELLTAAKLVYEPVCPSVTYTKYDDEVITLYVTPPSYVPDTAKVFALCTASDGSVVRIVAKEAADAGEFQIPAKDVERIKVLVWGEAMQPLTYPNEIRISNYYTPIADSFVVVEKAYTSINEDNEPVFVVEGYQDGEKIVLYAGDDPGDLAAGDVILAEANAAGEVSKIEVLFTIAAALDKANMKLLSESETANGETCKDYYGYVGAIRSNGLYLYDKYTFREDDFGEASIDDADFLDLISTKETRFLGHTYMVDTTGRTISVAVSDVSNIRENNAVQDQEDWPAHMVFTRTINDFTVDIVVYLVDSDTLASE